MCNFSHSPPVWTWATCCTHFFSTLAVYYITYSFMIHIRSDAFEQEMEYRLLQMFGWIKYSHRSYFFSIFILHISRHRRMNCWLPQNFINFFFHPLWLLSCLKEHINCAAMPVCMTDLSLDANEIFGPKIIFHNLFGVLLAFEWFIPGKAFLIVIIKFIYSRVVRRNGEEDGWRRWRILCVCLAMPRHTLKWCI